MEKKGKMDVKATARNVPWNVSYHTFSVGCKNICVPFSRHLSAGFLIQKALPLAKAHSRSPASLELHDFIYNPQDTLEAEVGLM